MRAQFAFVRTAQGIAIRLPPGRLGGSDLVYVISEKEKAVLEAADPLDEEPDNFKEPNLDLGRFPEPQLLQEGHVFHVLKDFVLNLSANAHPRRLLRRGRRL